MHFRYFIVLVRNLIELVEAKAQARDIKKLMRFNQRRLRCLFLSPRISFSRLGENKCHIQKCAKGLDQQGKGSSTYQLGRQLSIEGRPYYSCAQHIMLHTQSRLSLTWSSGLWTIIIIICELQIYLLMKDGIKYKLCIQILDL